MTTTSGVPSAYLRLGQGGIAAGGFKLSIQRSIDLSSGRTVAAVGEYARTGNRYAPCGPSAAMSSGLEFVASRTHEDQRLPLLHFRGTWNPSEARWIWQLPWARAEDTPFALPCDRAGTESGRTFCFCSKLIRANLDPGSSEISIFDVPWDAGFAVGEGAALGEFVVWPELQRSVTGTRVRGWKPDGAGIRTLLDGIPVDTCSVAISDTAVAGFSAANACNSFQPEGRLWVADHGPGDTLTNLRVGPVFWPEPVVGSDPVKTWGNFAAVVWTEQYYETMAERRRLLVARTTDWSMRELRGPESHEVWTTALTDRYLYVIYSQVNMGTGVGQFSHVYRYDLEHFDTLGVAVPPVEPAP